MWVCTRHPSAQLTAFPAFSSTGGTGKCHYLFRGQVFGFHASMMRLRNAERWSIVNELGIKSMSFLRRPLDPSPCHSLTPEMARSMNLRGSVKAEPVVTPVRNATFVYGPDLGVSEPERAKGTFPIGSDMPHLPLIPSQRAHVIHMRTGKTAPQL
jgi:hypothetical protein